MNIFKFLRGKQSPGNAPGGRWSHNMGKWKLSALFAAAGLIVGCATGEKIGKLEPGMNRVQVNSVMGQPDGYQQQSGYEVLKYSNRLMSGWSWDRADYYVLLKDGKVVEYGNGVVREKSPNSGVLVVVPAR